MGSLGTMEMVVILVIALVVFGPRKLPDLGRSLGRSLNEFKRASNELRNTLDEEIRVEEQRTSEKPKPEAATLPAEPAQPAAAAVPDVETVPRQTGNA
jgi:TatA/E family protein of Tat protein translocase